MSRRRELFIPRARLQCGSAGRRYHSGGTSVENSARRLEEGLAPDREGRGVRLKSLGFMSWAATNSRNSEDTKTLKKNLINH